MQLHQWSRRSLHCTVVFNQYYNTPRYAYTEYNRIVDVEFVRYEFIYDINLWSKCSRWRWQSRWRSKVRTSNTALKTANSAPGCESSFSLSCPIYLIDTPEGTQWVNTVFSSENLAHAWSKTLSQRRNRFQPAQYELSPVRNCHSSSRSFRDYFTQWVGVGRVTFCHPTIEQHHIYKQHSNDHRYFSWLWRCKHFWPQFFKY